MAIDEALARSCARRWPASARRARCSTRCWHTRPIRSTPPRLEASGLPLADQPQIEAWEDYARESQGDGVLPALTRRLVQFRFPIAAGISQTDAYRAATRRGVMPPGDGPVLTLEDPDGLELVLRPTLAGRVPVITCATRGDFVALCVPVRAATSPRSCPTRWARASSTG